MGWEEWASLKGDLFYRRLSVPYFLINWRLEVQLLQETTVKTSEVFGLYTIFEHVSFFRLYVIFGYLIFKWLGTVSGAAENIICQL